MRRPSVPVILLGVAASGSVAAAAFAVSPPETEAPQSRTVSVSRGVIQSVVSGSGNLAPARQVELSFGASGEVTKVNAKEGERVVSGEVLARIDDSAARVELAQAEAELASANDQLDAALDAESESTTSASAAPTTAGETTLVSLAVRTAQAQAPTPTPTATPTPTPSATPEPTPTPSPTPEPTPTPTPAAPSGGDAPDDGGSSGGGGSEGDGSSSTMSVASAQAAVDSAELAVEEAQEALDATVLRAPVSGTIAEVSGAVGDTVGGSSSSSSGDDAAATAQDTPEASTGSEESSAFITLVQLRRFEMEVSLSEADIGDVKVGQPATITVNSAEGQQFAARVTKIGVLSATSDTSSAVSYRVTLRLRQSSRRLKPGMSASADIVTAESSGLTVPTQALQGSSVTVVEDGTQETRQVRTGVAGESTTEVLSGLSEGDEVLVTSTAATGTGTGAGGAEQGAGGAAGGGGLQGGGAGGGGFPGGGAGGGFPGGAPPGGGGGP